MGSYFHSPTKKRIIRPSFVFLFGWRQYFRNLAQVIQVKIVWSIRVFRRKKYFRVEQSRSQVFFFCRAKDTFPAFFDSDSYFYLTSSWQKTMAGKTCHPRAQLRIHKKTCTSISEWISFETPEKKNMSVFSVLK